MLSVKQQKIICHRLGGYSYKEIMRKLRVTEDQIKYALKKAKRLHIDKSKIARDLTLKYKQEGYSNQNISDAIGLSVRTVVGIKE